MYDRHIITSLVIALCIVSGMSTVCDVPTEVGIANPMSEKYGIPEPYYTHGSSLDPACEAKSMSELQAALKGIHHLQKYEVNVYDCTEMSAYCERLLENQGFDVSILSNGKHAWIIVNGLTDREEVHVECTRKPPGVKITNLKYSRMYEDIYAACGRNTNTSCPAWNWWTVMPTDELKKRM